LSRRRRRRRRRRRIVSVVGRHDFFVRMLDDAPRVMPKVSRERFENTVS
jgi:hypothetical protein